MVEVRDAICKTFGEAPWRPGRARRVALLAAGRVFDDGMAVFHRGPRSFTGEDTLEITLHGNPLLVEQLIDACCTVGARLARPGEFTRRAVVSGKLSLVEAEGIDLAIRSTSAGGLAIARAAPELGRTLAGLRQEVVVATAELEARLDYPADELALEADAELVDRLGQVVVDARRLAASHRVGRLLVEGARVAIVGEVNAGKSSLFNRLVGQRRALVHDTPGTTRDVVETRCRIGSLEVTLLDTAGERVTDDPIEAAGLALAADLVAKADLLLVVLRADRRTDTERAILARTAHQPRLVVANQVDRGREALPDDAIAVSTHTGEGLDGLTAAIEQALVGQPGDPEAIVGTLRQAELLTTIAEACEASVEALDFAGVAVAADELVQALEAVDALTGADTREDVLDALFARFCIGK